MNMGFYSSPLDHKHLNRPITLITNKDCKIKMPCNVITPTIQVSRFDGWNDVRVVYIGELYRYYYVLSATMEEGGVVSYSLKADVLLTYGQSLASLNALIDRQEFVYSPMIEDPLLRVRVNRQKQIKSVGSFGNPTSGSNYCLITNGGNGGI